ncbi:MAG TPA: hypothetical protein VGQ57_18845, partial [Polyangiaceae bacterium]|nr:hypothetical protein [Polyangiaceae bacterium]
MDARARDLGPGRTRFRRVARFVLRAGLVLVLVILALPPLALFSLRFQAPRTLVAGELDGALSGTFRGRLHFDRLERVDLGGARLSGRIDDASGKRVVRFQGADVRLSVPRLLVRLVRDGGTPSLIHLDRVSIDDVELSLIDDGSGGPSIAHAFDPRTPSPSPSTGPSPTVELPVITLRHAWVHGQLGTSPLIDVELKDLASSLGVDPKLFHVEMKRAELVSRLSPMTLDPKGRLEGALRIPLGAGAMSARGSLSGEVAGTPLDASGSLDGNKVDARATLPAIEQPTVARFAPNLALRGKLKVVATASGTTDSLAYDLHAAGELGELEARGTLVSTPELRVSSTVTGRRLDASALVPGAPATGVDLDAQLAVRSAGSKLAVDGDLRARESGVNAQAKVALRLAGERGSVEGDVQ